MSNLKKTAVLYVRVNSTPEQAEKQLEQLWAFAESKGYSITNCYYEIVSGVAHVHDRTIWHMLQDAKDHKFNTVIVRDISRISRVMQDALFVLNELEASGIKLVTQRGSATPLPFEAAL